MNPIKLQRVVIDMKLAECARRCGWSLGTQSGIENGTIRLTDSRMDTLEAVLGIDLRNFRSKHGAV